jgi:hypothetical protein
MMVIAMAATTPTMTTMMTVTAASRTFDRKMIHVGE